MLEVPEVGRKAAPGDAVAVVESVKAASDVFTPVGGEVVEVPRDVVVVGERVEVVELAVLELMQVEQAVQAVQELHRL